MNAFDKQFDQYDFQQVGRLPGLYPNPLIRHVVAMRIRLQNGPLFLPIQHLISYIGIVLKVTSLNFDQWLVNQIGAMLGSDLS